MAFGDTVVYTSVLFFFCLLGAPLTLARPLPPPSSALSRPHPPAAPADGIGDGRNNAGTGASKNSANAPVAYPTCRHKKQAKQLGV